MDQETTGEAVPATTLTVEEMSFTGNAGEFFRIWIVNLCLTIVTLGIYSPWAKVRRNKYLYRHTQLAGASFDYHAQPVAILKGRLIAVALLGGYLLASTAVPLLSLAILLLIFLLMPWLLVRSRMFAMRNTSYRNVRFRFKPVYAESYKTILWYSFLTLITFGIAFAWLRFHRAKMIIDHTAYGTLDMKLGDEVSGGSFFGIYFFTGLYAGILIAIMTGVAAFMFTPDTTTGSQDMSVGGAAWQALSLLPLLTGILYLGTYYAISYSISRLLFSATSADQHRLRCNWNIINMMMIQLVNLVAIVASIGLLIPWAILRMHRYKMSNMSVAVDGDLASIAATQEADVSALGDEIGEAFDYDFGF